MMKAQIGPIMISLLLFTAAWLFLPSTCVAQVKKMSAQELTNESTSILYGKCTRLESAWTEDKSMILTRVTVVPDQYLKGNLGNEVTITVPGGQVGDIIYEVSEMPAFQKDEEVFAFIWQHPSGMNLVTGGYQGKLRISVDAKTGRKTLERRQLEKMVPKQLVKEPTVTSQKTTKAAKAPTLPQTKSERISLDDFTKEVQGYLNQR
jgi:hypothetical protein